MAIRVPRPSDVLGAAQTVAGLPSDVIRMLTRLGGLIDQAETLLARADRLLGSAEQTMAGVNGTTRKAEEAVARADATTRSAQHLMAEYSPMAERAAPMARVLIDELSEQELHAAVRLIDQLPALTEHMEHDIMPILATLDRVGPDIHDLLDVTRDVRQAIIGVPGFAFFRRRGEDREEEDRDEPAPQS
jgi:ABC-type transporter Mla subunit MlaD